MQVGGECAVGGDGVGAGQRAVGAVGIDAGAPGNLARRPSNVK